MGSRHQCAAEAQFPHELLSCLESRLDHAVEGGRVLRELGLADVAVLVERHVHLGPFDPAGPVTEAEKSVAVGRRMNRLMSISVPSAAATPTTMSTIA